MITTSVNDQLPLVLLQQTCVPHYRRSLFEAIGSDERFRLRIVADPTANVPYLSLASTVNHCEFEPAKQITIALPFGRSLWWQPRALVTMMHDRPDVVIAQGNPYDLTAWTLAVVGRVLGIPVLLWTHGLQGEEAGLKWMVRASLYRLSRGLLLYGDYAKQLLIAKGFAEKRLEVIYNSLDDSTQASVSERMTAKDCDTFRRSLGIDGHERIICFTGRLQPVKRLPWLLHALNLVIQQGKAVHLVVVGDGAERPTLESLAAELGISRFVHFLGALYDESQLGVILSASDLAVVPSGAGLSVMHALSYGTPVLIHDRVEDHFPEWEAVKDGETGWFYQCDDVSDCARKIIDALFPIPRKPEMQAACRAMITNRYNTKTHAALFIRAIAKCCALISPNNDDPVGASPILPPRSLKRSAEVGG